LWEGEVYKQKDKRQLSFEDFYQPFGGKLRKNNRWIIMSKLIPWDEFEEKYAELFADSGMGAPAEQISENPYMQYLIGRESFSNEEPFNPSMMVHFRKRIDEKMLEEINERIHERIHKKNGK
jgi:transposase, IS5 family